MAELGPFQIAAMLTGVLLVVTFLHIVARTVGNHAERVELFARANLLRDQYQQRIEAIRNGEALSDDQFAPVADKHAA